MDYAAGVRPFRLVCSTAIANICSSVKWIIFKKGFYFVRSSCSQQQQQLYFVFILFFDFFLFLKSLPLATFHHQVCNETLPLGFLLFTKVLVSIK